MWYLDNKRYNKRIGAKLILSNKFEDQFEFNSASDEENEFIHDCTSVEW